MEITRSTRSPRKSKQVREEDGTELFNAWEDSGLLPPESECEIPRPLTDQEEQELAERMAIIFAPILKSPRVMKKSELREQGEFAQWMNTAYPRVRFYSTLNGAHLGRQWGKIQTVQWSTEEGDHRGVPDVFVFKSNGHYSMLVIELKKTGTREGKDEHARRQRSWLDYLAENCNAFCVVASGVDEAISLTKKYLGTHEQKTNDNGRARAARVVHNEDPGRQAGKAKEDGGRARMEDVPGGRPGDRRGFVRAGQR